MAGRKRYVVNMSTMELEEVPLDYVGGDARLGPVTDLYMDGVRAVDGTDIGSRRKRRNYMRANGLADADDYKGTWAKAEAQRNDPNHGRAERREDVQRVIHQLSNTRRR